MHIKHVTNCQKVFQNGLLFQITNIKVLEFKLFPLLTNLWSFQFGHSYPNNYVTVCRESFVSVFPEQSHSIGQLEGFSIWCNVQLWQSRYFY